MDMSIAAMSVAMNQQQTSQDLGIAVLKQALGAAENTGQMTADMLADNKALSLAAQPNLGANLDIMA